MIFIDDTLNASEGHIYFRDTDLGKDAVTGASAGTRSLLTIRDNGRGMSEKTWTERASRICRAADTRVDYTPDLAQTLSRFGGILDPSHHHCTQEHLQVLTYENLSNLHETCKGGAHAREAT